MRNKIFTKIIITTLLVAFLTFNVGRVTRVSAVGTTAAIAGTAFILTGAVYLSYVALTQGEIILPAADEMHNWLGGIGRKVSQFPSGAEAYQDIYQGLLFPVGNVIDGVWTWTEDRIKSFVNDFSDTRIIGDIIGYEYVTSVDDIPLNGYDYQIELINVPELYMYDGNLRTPENLVNNGYTIVIPSGPVAISSITNSNSYAYVNTSISNPVRNVLNVDGTYSVQQFFNGSWNYIDSYSYGRSLNTQYNLRPCLPAVNYWNVMAPSSGLYIAYPSRTMAFPLFPNEVIYDMANDENLPMVVPETRTQLPSWIDPDNENRPIIPWVPIPDIPTGVPVPPGYIEPPQWGFPLQDLLDLIESLAESLMTIGSIGELINSFAGQHGDNYYLEYNDGDTNYYTYYQPTIFDNDNEYVTYNINISDQDDVIPVDLNTISLYTQNKYLDKIKQSAIAGSSIIRDLAVFWYDVDPEVTYIVFGCCILVLIGAFTGKLGHS